MTPETNNNIKKSPLKLVLIIFAFVIFVTAVVLILTLTNGTPGADKADSDTTLPTEQTEGEPDGDTVGEIVTPVATLVFPSEFAGDVQMEDTSTDGKYAASFYAKEDGGKVFLFELSVGDEENGYQIGSVPDKDGNYRAVWINIKPIEADPSWSEEKADRINTLQSCVNDLIDQLHHIEGFRVGSNED